MSFCLTNRSFRGAAVTGLLLATASLAPAQRSRAAGQPSDQVLTVKVQNALNAEHVFDGMSVVPTVSHGVVTLSGTVTSDAAKILASNEAGSVTGVKTVLNNLTVQTGAAVPVAPPPPLRPSPIATAEPPQTRMEQIPSGTVIPVRTNETLTSKTAKAGDEFHGTVTADVLQDGLTVIPRGTPVQGRVAESKAAGHFSGSALLTIELVSMQISTPSGPQTLQLVTEPVSSQGKGRGANTAEKTAGGAGVGALIGALAGGGAGAGIGALAGGGLGAGVNGVTRGQDVTVPAESLLKFTLSSTAQVPVQLRHGKQVMLPPPSRPALQTRPPAGDSGDDGVVGQSPQ